LRYKPTMKTGRASRTAELVCMARAVAHGATTVPGYQDPTALALLPDDVRERVEQIRAKAIPKDLRSRWGAVLLERRATMMVVRTVTIDDAIRRARSPQLVILGAGLDGRAWRMPELADVVVYEVDHPDSQRDKRSRVGALQQVAREVRFVPVDFERDPLDHALARAGHDATRPTTWVWEGVVMYLTADSIEASLRVIEGRSADKSRLIVAYHSPAFLLRIVGLIVRRLGEPLRSVFTADAMRALLDKHRFTVSRDDNLPELGSSFSEDVARATKVMKHMRIAVADRLPR
jgi:methyltransferase (TIGR00027 family)